MGTIRPCRLPYVSARIPAEETRVKRLLHIINEVPLGWLFAGIAATVLLFALGYWAAAQGGYLVYTWDPAGKPGFADSVYFSIVTVSSLGYGDIRPLGWARLLVALEVFAGLAFFGLLVAKVSSVKQDYILRRMYGEAVDEKLAHLHTQLDEQRTLYRTTSTLLLDGEIDPALTTTFRRDTPGATFFSGYRQLLADVSSLMLFEASNHALFGVVDDSRIESIYDSIRGVLRRTTLIWERDRTLAADHVLRGNEADLTEILDLAEKDARLALANSANPDIVRIADAIVELAETIRTEILPQV